MQTFRLIPYPANDLPQIEITGEIKRIENQLSIRYAVTGEIKSIRLPAQSENSSRQHDLWKATCFEFFLAIKDQPGYWEFNMSPSGDWNVYAMDAYRQVNMREEFAFTQLPFDFGKTNGNIVLEISTDLSPIIHLESQLQIGITTIIQTNNGDESYWALAHPSPQADFHLRDGFLIQI